MMEDNVELVWWKGGTLLPRGHSFCMKEEGRWNGSTVCQNRQLYDFDLT